MRKTLISIFVLLTVLSQNVLAQQTQTYSKEIESKIQAVESSLIGPISVEGQRKWTLTERMTHHKVPGLTIAVVKDYKIEWAKAYGVTDAESNAPVTTSTLFQAASISKSINGIGVLKLVQEGKIDLNADINNYLKSWKFPYDSLSKGMKITTANLLSHTAGLSVHGFRGYAASEKVPDIYAILDGKAPANSAPIRSQFEPNTRVKYSGGGTTISQLIIMDVSGKKYADYMRENVLRPLGMKSSFYDQPTATMKANLATGHRSNGKPVDGKFHFYPEQGAASLWTTPTDLAQYIIETQLSYQGKSSKVLSQKFTQLRLTPFKESAGFGVFIDNKNGERYFQHGGANEGFRCQYFGHIDKGYGVVVMVNSDNGAIVQEVINGVATVYGWSGFTEVKKPFALNAQELSSLEGYYQSENMKNTYLQFFIKDGQLILKQLWDGREILFLPESNVDFFATEFPFPLKFTRGDDGTATKVLAFNRDTWIKDATYKPVVKKAITLTKDQLKAVEGKYRLQQNKELIVQVTSVDDHLVVKQLWNGEEMIFLAESDLKFFAQNNQNFPVRFIKNDAGAIVQAIAFERDMLDKVLD